MSTAIKNRYDFVFLFDVKDGNPNGDPDQDNLPRADVENQEGLVSDVCIKRKVRNYVQLLHANKSPYNIFIKQGEYLNKIIGAAKGETIPERQSTLCAEYYDIRTFGAVLATGEKEKSDKEDGKVKNKKSKGAGTVRGPVQFTFSRSEDRIYQSEHSITRCVVTTEKEFLNQSDREYASTFGRKNTVPYALYRMHGFISAVDAVKTGFSDDDLQLLWDGLLNAFEHDRAAARGEMNPRKLIVFKHQSHLGNARSGELFDRVKITKSVDLPRSWADYSVLIEKANLPAGIDIIEKL